ncbi:MAG TPA: zf-HC2 domain-containing protein, partial [Candidatus Krumholzibacterium sp.]|nr:zf-HC2 domain-containing protein [Candidatus Krumholzibacterium sp.]
MNCRLFKMLIQSYHDGELELGEMAEYENHRDRCAACAQADAEFASVFTALSGIGHLEPSPGFNASVMAHVDVARYRVSAWKKIWLSVRGFWRGLPSPIQATTVVASVFALFVGIYTPFLMMMMAAARTLAGYAMS